MRFLYLPRATTRRSLWSKATMALYQPPDPKKLICESMAKRDAKTRP
jgi:hypothetical protein